MHWVHDTRQFSVPLEYEFVSVGLQLFSIFSYRLARMTRRSERFDKKWNKLMQESNTSLPPKKKKEEEEEEDSDL